MHTIRILLLVVLAHASASSAVAATRLVAGPSAAARGDPKIDVGQSWSTSITAECHDAFGNPLADTVTFNVSGAPNTGGATATFVPNPQATFTPTEFTASTTRTTAPGNYTMVVTGNGPVCGFYGTLNLPLTVRPLIEGDAAMWWFNGATPAGYDVTRTLTAVPSGQGPYTWTLTAGTAEAEFSNGSSTIVTPTETVEVRSKGTAAGGARNGVKLKVQAKGADSTRFSMTVHIPASLRLLRNNDAPDATFGYESSIHYRILDQFGRVLPGNVPINEQWTGGQVNDFPGSTWRRGPEGAATVSPNNWRDRVQGEAAGFVPPAIAPQTPLGNTAVQHWPGQWFVGSSTIGSGQRVQTNVWQKYLDHARHTVVVTPAP